MPNELTFGLFFLWLAVATGIFTALSSQERLDAPRNAVRDLFWSLLWPILAIWAVLRAFDVV